MIIAGSSIDTYGLSLGWRDIGDMRLGVITHGYRMGLGFDGSFGEQTAAFRLLFPIDHEAFPEREITETLHALTEETLGVIKAFELLCFGAVAE